LWDWLRSFSQLRFFLWFLLWIVLQALWGSSSWVTARKRWRVFLGFLLRQTLLIVWTYVLDFLHAHRWLASNLALNLTDAPFPENRSHPCSRAVRLESRLGVLASHSDSDCC
jgi:hypothetical protein